MLKTLTGEIKINKEELFASIIDTLERTYQNAQSAVARAYHTATDNENVAENKYDTLALEASYLAHGQAKRVAECEADLIAFKKLDRFDSVVKNSVTLGCLVDLVDDDEKHRYVFLGPCAGGLTFVFEQKEVIIVTLSSPLGAAIKSRQVDDLINIVVGNKVVNYEIAMIY